MERRRGFPNVLTGRTGCEGALAVAFFLFLIVPVAAQVTIPFSADRPIVGDLLTQQVLDSFSGADLGSNAEISVYLVEMKTGMVDIDINSDVPRTPASLVKLVTAGFALDTLEPDYRFDTTLEILGDVENGVLYGDLVIRGGGDPSLGPRFSEKPSDVTALFKGWAREVKALGIREIVGNVVGDDRRYEDDRLGLGWEPREFAEWYSAEVSALNYNENVIDVIWRAGSRPEDPVKFELMPRTNYVLFVQGVRTGPQSLEESQVRYFRFRDNNEIRARGRVPVGSTVYDFAAIGDPARYTAYLFMEELERAGIEVKGAAMVGRQFDDAVLDVEGTTITRVQSPPLRKLLPIVVGDSQNLYAEVLLRESAHQLGRETTFREASRAATDWLIARDIHRSGFLMVDGSGLSPVNRMPARMAGNLLMYIHRSPNGDLFRGSLATPGSGSLKDRFKDTKYAPLKDGLHAKTGYLGDVHALAGYLTNKRGSDYVFVVLVSNFHPRRTMAARDCVDDLMLKLYGTDILP